MQRIRFLAVTITIISTILVSTALAEDSTSATPAPTEKKGEWKTSASLGINATRGNSQSNLFSGGVRGELEREQNIWRVEVLGANGDKDGESTQDMAKAEADYKRLLDERLYLGMNSSILYDDIAAVRYRVPLSPFVGYYFLKDDTYKLSGEAGPSYIFEKIGSESKEYLAPRVAERFEWTLTPTSKFFQSAEMFISAEDSEDFLVNTEAGVEAALTTKLSLVLSAKDQFDNIPAKDKDRNDFYLTTALKVAL